MLVLSKFQLCVLTFCVSLLADTLVIWRDCLRDLLGDTVDDGRRDDMVLSDFCRRELRVASLDEEWIDWAELVFIVSM